jgi:hypothetical protein
LVSNFSFLYYFPSVVDGLNYLKAITDDHIFLHHLAKKVILHLTDDAAFFNRLDVLHQSLLLSQDSIVPSLCLHLLPFLLLQFLKILDFLLQIKALILLERNEESI